MTSRRITPVILSGGSGTRLWPLSRLGRPKQLIALSRERTMLQDTVRRASDSALFEAPLVVASADHAEAIEAQLEAIGIAPARLILEPAARNTAAAIALAALNAAEGAILLVMPSDHVVARPEAFRAAVEAALPSAAEGWIVTFGVAPERPETGYGYIRQGDALGGGLFRADRFTEKPDRETAQGWLAEGGWSWNAGIFLVSAAACLAALAEHAPDVVAAVRASVEAQRIDGARALPEPVAFARAPAVSFDRAVMERAARVAVVPVDMGWSDIGSWEALHALGPADADGNVLAGDVVAVGSTGCLIRSDGPVVVTLGARDMIVVATERAVLVAPLGEGQRVKEAIDALLERRAKPTI
jgi:mannose-1-phosphate guanylyltransferase